MEGWRRAGGWMHTPLICRSTLRHSPRISFFTFRIISFGSGPTTASLTASVTVLLLPPNILNIIACVKTGRCCCLRNATSLALRALSSTPRPGAAVRGQGKSSRRALETRERRRHVRAYRVLVVEAGEVEFDGHGGGANTRGCAAGGLASSRQQQQRRRERLVSTHEEARNRTSARGPFHTAREGLNGRS